MRSVRGEWPRSTRSWSSSRCASHRGLQRWCNCRRQSPARNPAYHSSCHSATSVYRMYELSDAYRASGSGLENSPLESGKSRLLIQLCKSLAECTALHEVCRIIRAKKREKNPQNISYPQGLRKTRLYCLTVFPKCRAQGRNTFWLQARAEV